MKANILKHIILIVALLISVNVNAEGFELLDTTDMDGWALIRCDQYYRDVRTIISYMHEEKFSEEELREMFKGHMDPFILEHTLEKFAKWRKFYNDEGEHIKFADRVYDECMRAIAGRK